MCRCIRFILVTIASVGLLQGQRVEETRLLSRTLARPETFLRGTLGSKLFAYRRSQNNLYRLEGKKEVLVYDPRSGLQEYLHNVQVSRDDSLIVFATSGFTQHYPQIIFSIRPDGSQLRRVVESGNDCRGRFIPESPFPPRPPYCSFPGTPRLSPDGQRILFFNKVLRPNNDKTYLSMIPVTGGPIVRLKELRYYDVVWNEDSTSFYYCNYYSDVPHRYDLETGRSEPITDASLKVRRPSSEVYQGASLLAVSRADGSIYVVSEQGLTRVDAETGFVELVSEELFDSFDLSPDGSRVVGVIAGDLTLVDLENRTSTAFQVEPGAVDELGLARILTSRRNPETSKPPRSSSKGIRNFGVREIRWIDRKNLWCVVGNIAFRESRVEVGIVQLR